ncbi:hypothetical protein P7K49_022133 [Saguinus oedipus]|uniref:Liprin-beta-1/2 coiled-coil domain-containing protein n=1 Tax=Saguinus oedipus TaxID=9490 RepID=A0ABQ9UVJ3_SAGOE|nr:hypothetical protein P7K49_022133 [Saguinus oedipus]
MDETFQGHIKPAITQGPTILPNLLFAIPLLKDQATEGLEHKTVVWQQVLPGTAGLGSGPWTQVNHHSAASNETYQERLARLEGDKESLILQKQVSVLTDQVEAQGEKIRDLEVCLEGHQVKLNAAEEMLQQVKTGALKALGSEAPFCAQATALAACFLILPGGRIGSSVADAMISLAWTPLPVITDPSLEDDLREEADAPQWIRARGQGTGTLELLSRTSLETQKLDLMTEVSELKLKLVGMEKEQREQEEKQRKAENKTKCGGIEDVFSENQERNLASPCCGGASNLQLDPTVATRGFCE